MVAAPPPQVSTDNGFVALQARGAGYGADDLPTSGTIKVGTFSGVATLCATVDIPLANAKEESHGMSLSRRYLRVQEGGSTPLQPGQPVPVGAEIFVELTVNAHDTASGWLRSAYYSIQDAVPAGFVPVEEDHIYRTDPYNLPLQHAALKRRRFDKEAVVLDFEEPAWWQDSPRVVGYVLRAQFPGSFITPPATLRDRFAPTVGAQTTSTQLTVAKP